MLGFLRRIRRTLIEEGQLRKYLAYAVGEIFLVVAGILIALQINTWNESSQEANIELRYLQRLCAEMQADTAYFASQIAISGRRIKLIQDFSDLLNDSTKKPSKLIDAATAYFNDGWYLPHFLFPS